MLSYESYGAQSENPILLNGQRAGTIRSEGDDPPNFWSQTREEKLNLAGLIPGENALEICARKLPTESDLDDFQLRNIEMRTAE